MIRKMKEISIIIVIIILVFIVNSISQSYTNQTVTEITTSLEELSSKIQNNEIGKEEKIGESKKIRENWKEKKEKLSYYIEHDELEKVETNLTEIIGYLENNNFEMAGVNIDVAIFILEHIQDKYEMSLENIF